MVPRWSKERVIEAIRARQRERSLRHVSRDDPGLYAAAIRFFGKWHGAVQAAGIEFRQKRWTKQAVVDAILARHREGLPMRGVYNHDMPLWAAANRYFGSWCRALSAVGLPVKARRRWTAQLVLTAIRDRHRQGLPLRGVAVYDRSLLRAAERYWGGWQGAIRAVGGDVFNGRRDRQTIIAELQAFPQHGVPLKTRELSHPLYYAICQVFGGLPAALIAAGLPTRPSPPAWSRSEVLTAIQLRYRERRSLASKANRSLSSAAVRHFGSWLEALRIAGLDVRPRRHWTRQQVLDQLQALQQQGRFEDSTRIEDGGLLRAATRFFGTPRGALVAAGILGATENPRRRTKWNPSRVIAAIQDRYVRGLSMLARANTKLSSIARRYFGSWRAALSAAGLDVGPPPRAPRKWTKQSVIESLRELHRPGQQPTKGKDYGRIVGAARSHFGGLYNARIAAGIVGPHAKRYPLQRWSKHRILQQIRALHRPSASPNSCRPAQRLASAARRYFGGWRQAMAAAGIPWPFKQRKWGPQRVLDALENMATQGDPLTRAHAGHALYCAARRYFGSWPEALAAAGLTIAAPDESLREEGAPRAAVKIRA